MDHCKHPKVQLRLDSFFKRETDEGSEDELQQDSCWSSSSPHLCCRRGVQINNGKGVRDDLKTEEPAGAFDAAATPAEEPSSSSDDPGSQIEVEIEDVIESDLGTLETGPEQPRLKVYPFSNFGLQRRAFQEKWFDMFEWLEYSVSQNSAFCYSCRIFGKQTRRPRRDSITSLVGFYNWKRALDSFREHDTCARHKASVLAWKSYKATLCCADEVKAGILKEMKHSKMYAVMADEAGDGHVEQLAVCVRYVGSDDAVKESFLQLSNLKSYDAVSIADAIEEVLESNGLQELRCVAQACDGAAVLRGPVGEVQALFRERHPEAVYVHCYTHELNLVLCHTCKAVSEVSDFFDTLESLCSLFSVSLMHHKTFTDMQKVLGLAGRDLVQQSKTRWACQLQSVTAVIANLPALLRCLAEMNNATTVGLLSKLDRLSCVYMLVMFKSLLSTTEGLHKYLQKQDLDLARATTYKDAVLETLKSMRTDDTADQIHKQARDIFEANNLLVTSTSRDASRKRKKMRYDDYVVESTTDTRSQAISGDELRHHIFYPCIDRMLSELERRFCGVGSDLMKGIQACHPGAEDFLCVRSLELIANHYKISLSEEEILVAKHFLEKKKLEGTISDVASVYTLLDPDMFPNLRAVFQVALTIPVSSCSCERSLCALHRLHTWLKERPWVRTGSVA